MVAGSGKKKADKDRGIAMEGMRDVLWAKTGTEAVDGRVAWISEVEARDEMGIA